LLEGFKIQMANALGRTLENKITLFFYPGIHSLVE
jgi:hypothetical protein